MSESKGAAPQYLMVPVDRIEPNAYNPNQMDEARMALLSTLVNEDGMVQPPLVRPHPEKGEGWYILVDGEHRWRTACATGATEIMVCVVDYDEATAMLRTLSMNAIRGRNVPIRLANMIADLQRDKGMSADDIAKLTGVPLDEMTTALKLLEIPDFDADMTNVEGAFGTDAPPPTQLTLVLMPHEKTSYERAMERAMLLAGADATALIGIDTEHYKLAMGQAMGVSGVKLRNVALATICEAFLHLTDDQKKMAADLIAEKASERFLDDAITPIS